MSVTKITNGKLADMLSYQDFTAYIELITDATVRLKIDERSYSLKVPVDFKLNRVIEGDVIKVSPSLAGERVNLLILEIYHDGKKVGLTERHK